MCAVLFSLLSPQSSSQSQESSLQNGDIAPSSVASTIGDYYCYYHRDGGDREEEEEAAAASFFMFYRDDGGARGKKKN